MFHLEHALTRIKSVRFVAKSGLARRLLQEGLVSPRMIGLTRSYEMPRGLRRRMAVLVMLPVLLLAGIAQASVLYRCGMDGQLRKSCCCGPGQAQSLRSDRP